MSILQNVSKKVYKIYFDNRDLEQLFAVQNDTNARTYQFQIISNNGLVQDLANVTLEFTVQMGDKKQSVSGELIDSEKGIYEVTLTSSMLQIAGVGQAQITLIDSTSAKLSSKDMTILIRPSLEFGGGTVEGEDLWFTFTMLTDAIADSKSLRDEYTQSLQTQTALHQDVTDKHGEVVSMYATLESVFTSETERINAEKARVSAENARIDAEATRVSAENTRESQETARVDAEDARNTAETERNAKEQERLTAELERIANELARVDAESKRATSESARASAETQREQLYQDLLALQQILGDDPVVELANAVNDLQQAFDSLEVGGRNLAPNSRKEFSFTNEIYNHSLNEELLKEYIGEFLTISFYAKADEEGHWIDAYLRDDDKRFSIDGKLRPFEVSTEYGRFSYTAELTDISEINNLSLSFKSTYGAGESVRVYIRKTQIEKGKVATDWTPALEDIDEKIALRLKTSDLKTEIQKIDGSGSGIDADMVDGKHATDFATSTHNHDGTYAPTSHTHPASMITQDSTRRMVSDTQIATWNGKVDKAGGQMTGALVVNPSGNTRQARNIAIGTTEPSSTVGYSEGDIYLVVP